MVCLEAAGVCCVGVEEDAYIEEVVGAVVVHVGGGLGLVECVEEC